jgi:hypothetical protein
MQVVAVSPESAPSSQKVVRELSPVDNVRSCLMGRKDFSEEK